MLGDRKCWFVQYTALHVYIQFNQITMCIAFHLCMKSVQCYEEVISSLLKQVLVFTQTLLTAISLSAIATNGHVPGM